MEIAQAYKYCPRCSNLFKSWHGHLRCDNCNLEFYINPKPVNSVIIKNDKNEYLFVVRAIEPKKGYLDFPGGFVEENENFEESMRREIKEELGVSIDELEYLSTHIDEYLYQGINHKVVGVTYLASMPIDAKLLPADDVAGFKFYKLDSIPSERLAFPSMHEMIRKLKELDS